MCFLVGWNLISRTTSAKVVSKQGIIAQNEGIYRREHVGWRQDRQCSDSKQKFYQQW